MESHEEIYEKLHHIYQKHRKKYKRNPDSKQMCCMWSTSSPPDMIEGTAPLCDIENTFNISINENEALELYDMGLKEAVSKIEALKREQ